MKRKPTKKLKPIEARTHDQICSIPRDHLDTKYFWLLIETNRVILCEQKTGEASKGSLSIPRAEFDRLARWYVTGRTHRPSTRIRETR